MTYKCLDTSDGFELPIVVNDVIVIYIAGCNNNDDPKAMDIPIMLIELLISYAFEQYSNINQAHVL